MVKVNLRQKNPDNLDEWIEEDFYLDGYIKSNLDLGLEQLHDDFDQVWFIDGGEGEGKSDMAAQYGYYVNPEETRHTFLDRFCLSAEEFDQVILNAKQFDSVVLDEAFGGMSSSGTMARINRVLQRRFTEIRAKNLFIFIVAPSFMDIMRYFAIWRSKCLLHVYLSKERKRGFCAFYGEKKKRKLFILGKKNFYNYSVVSPQFTFRFIKQMHKCFDLSKYLEKKRIITTRTAEDMKEEKVEAKKRQFVAFFMKNLEKMGNPLTPQQKAQLFGYSMRNNQEIAKEMRENELIAENIVY
jgi:hypothetical protein